MADAFQRWKSRETLIDELVLALAPAEDRLDELMVAIERDQKIVSTCRRVEEGRSPEELRAYPKKYHKALSKLRRLTDGLGIRDRSLLFRGLPAAVQAVDAGRQSACPNPSRSASEYYVSGALVDPGSSPWDAMKYAAALRAYYLVREFSQKKPSRMRGGVAARVATLLFELATGKPGADISDYLVQGLQEPMPPMSGPAEAA